jgi:hypothetical protein
MVFLIFKPLTQARMIGLRSQALGYGFMRMSLALTQGYRAYKPLPFLKARTMRFLSIFRPLWVLLALSASLPNLSLAQQKLKWAHVYEATEPYHTESVWAAEEIKKRSNGKFDIQVFPASSLGKETDLNQGLTLGSVDIDDWRPIVCRTQLPSLWHRLLPLYLPRW